MNRDDKFNSIPNDKQPLWKLMREYVVEKDGVTKSVWTTMANKQSLIDQGYKIVRQ
jgi:hypothetical protein